MQRDVRALRDGALGGAVATVAMTGVMVGAQRLGLMGESPPERIAGAVLAASGRGTQSEGEREALAVAGHFGFGAAAGALFAVIHRRLRPPIGAPLHGVLFASLIWFVSYKGWVPALGLLPPPERDQPGRPVTMLVAHWVYGATLGALVGRR